MTRGYAVIHPGSFSKGQWENIRRSGAALPAGQVTPSPKPFHPGGEPLQTLLASESGHKFFEAYAKMVARQLLGAEIAIVFANDKGWGFGGAFGPNRILYVNVLGRDHWFEVKSYKNSSVLSEIDAFLIHEFAHFKVRDHLSSKFHEECCRLGAKLVQFVREQAQEWPYLTGSENAGDLHPV